MQVLESTRSDCEKLVVKGRLARDDTEAPRFNRCSPRARRVKPVVIGRSPRGGATSRTSTHSSRLGAEGVPFGAVEFDLSHNRMS